MNTNAHECQCDPIRVYSWFKIGLLAAQRHSNLMVSTPPLVAIFINLSKDSKKVSGALLIPFLLRIPIRSFFLSFR